MPKKEPRLLRMFDTLKEKDEILVKGKWRRLPENQVGEQVCRDDIGNYRRWFNIEDEEY